MQGDADDGNYFFFSAPASPVHYILRSPPASSPYFAGAPADAGDCCGAAAAAAAGDFEFAAHGTGTRGGPGGTKGGVAMMSSAEELFVAGRIRVGCLSPIRQEDGECGGEEEEEREREWDGRSPRATRRARSVSPTRSPRADRSALAEPSGPFASASLSSSSSASSSSSSAKNIRPRRRMSLRDLLSRTGGDWAGADKQASSGAEVTSRLGFFWTPSIWPSSRSSKKSLDSPMPCPAPPQPGRRLSTSSDRAAIPTAAKIRAPPPGSARRTTSLPYRQGLVLGCLGYGLAKSMHPLPTRR